MKRIVIMLLLVVAMAFCGCSKINDNVSKQNNLEDDKVMNEKLYIKINDKVLCATLYDNSSVRGLLNELKGADISIKMNDYANMEKVGNLDFNLPTNDEDINTTCGDIILYQGNKFVIYYRDNSWSLTRLGKIDDIENIDLNNILGDGDVVITLSLKN